MPVGIIQVETALGDYQGEKLENARCKWMLYDAFFHCMIIWSLQPNLCPHRFLLPYVGWSCLRDESVTASDFSRALWQWWQTEGAQGIRLRSTAESEIVFG